MKHVIFLLGTVLITATGSAQNTPKKQVTTGGAYEFATGYTHFDNRFNGAHVTAGYGYSWSKNFLAHGAIALDFGKTPKKDGLVEDSSDAFMAVSAQIGLKGQLPLFGNHKLRGGPDVGFMFLNIDHGNITSNSHLFPIVYGFSLSYSVPINTKLEMGLAFTQHYMANYDYVNQRIGVLLIYNN